MRVSCSGVFVCLLLTRSRIEREIRRFLLCFFCRDEEREREREKYCKKDYLKSTIVISS